MEMTDPFEDSSFTPTELASTGSCSATTPTGSAPSSGCRATWVCSGCVGSSPRPSAVTGSPPR
jgi:hypothetical protein